MGRSQRDRNVVNLQMTDAPADMLELRALISARSPSQTWDLRCEVREKLIAFLQTTSLAAPAH